MKQLLASFTAISIAMGGVALTTAAPAAAQQVAPGVAVVNLPAVVANSNAYRTAEQQRPTTYKAQYDQATARRDALSAQLQPLYTQFNTARQAPNPDQAALQQQAAQIQQIEQAGQRELQQILAPVGLSRAYVEEQIQDQLDAAVKAAVAKKGVTLILDASQGAVIYAEPTYNITQDVLNELNTLLPAAQLVPPQGWQPREVREAQAAQAAAQQAAQAQQPAQAAPATTGR